MRFDDKLDLEAFVPQLEKQETGPSPEAGGNQGGASGTGQGPANSSQGNNLPPASGSASLEAPSGVDTVMQDLQGVNGAGMEMPDSPSESQQEANPELSPKALQNLPQEILAMLGSDALPAGMENGSGLFGSFSREEGDGQPVSDEQMQALIQAIAPLVMGKDGLQQDQEAVDDNPRSRLLKERMKAINERNLKRAAQKKRK